MSKTIFLTGATGNMGWAGFQELLKSDCHIKILARPSSKNKILLEDYIHDDRVTVIWGDLTCYEDVAAGVSGADYVLHVGGMVSPAADYFPEKTLEVNVAAAENIVRAVSARPDSACVKVVYIGSVAQYGDRMSPIHWGRCGDPVMASRYDRYSVSKCLAERIFADSGLRYWVSLRQSGILYPGIFRQINPVAFHVPVKGVLEWATIEDSGRLLARVCDDSVPEEFWNRFYNISSGEQYRLTNYEFEKRLLAPLGLDPEKIFEPEWFALKNFHGMWYTDSDILEEYLHFRENVPVDEYFARLGSALPWYYSLARFVPSFLIKPFMKRLASEKGLGTLSWIGTDDAKVEAYYGSMEAYESIGSWEHLKPGKMEISASVAMSAGELIELNHGYDTTESIYDLSLQEIRDAASFRGGRFLGDGKDLGKKGFLFEWECEHGHRFRSSLEYVLLGGGWCPDCKVDEQYLNVSPKNRFTSQVLEKRCLE